MQVNLISFPSRITWFIQIQKVTKGYKITTQFQFGSLWHKTQNKGQYLPSVPTVLSLSPELEEEEVPVDMTRLLESEAVEAVEVTKDPGYEARLGFSEGLPLLPSFFSLKIFWWHLRNWRNVLTFFPCLSGTNYKPNWKRIHFLYSKLLVNIDVFLWCQWQGLMMKYFDTSKVLYREP